jgi:hypothetical protein
MSKDPHFEMKHFSKNDGLYFKHLLPFYLIAVLFLITNFLPIMHNFREENIVDENLSDSTVNWFVACFVIAIPLLFEFLMDALLSLVYPVYKTTITEHKTGQFTLLLSLFVPFILVVVSKYSTVNISAAKCMITFCHGLAVCAIYGQLQVFNPTVWKLWKVLSVFTLYVLSQVLFTFGKIRCNDPANFESPCPRYPKYVGLALAFSVLSCGLHLWIARKYLAELVFEKLRSAADSDSHFCIALNAILSVYLFTRAVLMLIVLCSDEAEQYSFRVKMALLMILVVVTAVVPGRMVRRRLMTVKVC